ncbi:Rhomboid family protein [Planctomycetes bacterium MalM25]|nr:Rhomboid family protein [Planctomycetes bacterium MalM25]
MGIYDRDYERSYDTGSGWRDGGGGPGTPGGFASWSVNGKLLAVMVAVYLFQYFTLDNGNPRDSWFTNLGVLHADWFREPWRLYGFFSYALLHSTSGLAHLLFNGIALFFFGRTIEARLGGREYLLFFFTAAAFAGLVWSLSELAIGDTRHELLGASGGIAAIIVLFALWYPNVQVYLMGVLPVPAWMMAILFIGQDVMGALSRSGNVAYTAHLGGALFGYLYYRSGWRITSWLPESLLGGAGLKDLFSTKPKLRVHHGDDGQQSDETQASDERLDEILRKIQQSGQDSLSRSEQRYLEQASRRFKDRRP